MCTGRSRNQTDASDVEYTWSPRPPYTTWSKPVIVSSDGPNHRNSAPSLATQQCGGATVLHLVWEDSAKTVSGPPWNVFYARKIAKTGAVWSKSIRVSDQPSFGEGLSVFGVLHPDLAVSQGRPFAIWTAWPDQTNKTDVYGSGILSGVPFH